MEHKLFCEENKSTQRKEVKAGTEKVSESTVSEIRNLKLSDLNRFLLYEYERRIGDMSPEDLFRRYEENRFSKPSEIDVKELKRMELFFIDSLPELFEMVEFSPMAPIGATSILTKVNSKTSLQTNRSVESVSDISIIMALESAKRRVDNQNWMSARYKLVPDVSLASAHRNIRGQVYEKEHYRHK